MLQRELRNFSLAYIHHVNTLARMYTAYVSTHIRWMSRPVDAVGTIKPRRLAALDLPVISEIVLHAEHAIAIAASEPRRPLTARRGDNGAPLARGRCVVSLPWVHQQWLGGCKKKAQDVFVIRKARDDRDRVASLLKSRFYIQSLREDAAALSKGSISRAIERSVAKKRTLALMLNCESWDAT